MKRNPALISIAITTMAIFAVFGISQRAVPRLIATNLEKLPMEIDNYKGIEDSFPNTVYDALNADHNLYRHYLSAAGKQVDLYIGYYGTAKGGRTGHNPYACLPGAGWAIIRAENIELSINKSTATPEILIAKKDDLYMVMLHWYQSDKNKVLTTGIQQNFHRFFNLILYNRNDGAFVRVSTMTNKYEIEDSIKMIAELSAKLIDIIPDYWPIEM